MIRETVEQKKKTFEQNKNKNPNPNPNPIYGRGSIDLHCLDKLD